MSKFNLMLQSRIMCFVCI